MLQLQVFGNGPPKLMLCRLKNATIQVILVGVTCPNPRQSLVVLLDFVNTYARLLLFLFLLKFPLQIFETLKLHISLKLKLVAVVKVLDDSFCSEELAFLGEHPVQV